MIPLHIGLVDTTGELDPAYVQTVAAALNMQVTRDLPRFWHVKASVAYLPHAQDVPVGVWQVRLVRHLPPGEGGFHLDRHNQPYAEVAATPADPGWSIDASHETLEMLVDPSGNRMHAAGAIEVADGKIRDGKGQFTYLVEACDPCQARNCGYDIQGVLVSDFITPHFYDSLATPGTSYSFNGALKAPRHVHPGGYITWLNHETGQWQQLLHVDPGKPPRIHSLTVAATRSFRALIDGEMRSA